MSAAPALGKTKNLQFEVTTGPLKGKTFVFAKPIITIGRSSENDIAIESDLKISRSHVEIHQNSGGISFQNKNDKNMMLVNGMAASFFPMNTAECVLRIGDSEIRVRIEGGAQSMHRPLYMPNGGPAGAPPLHSVPPLPQYTASGGQQSKIVFYAIIGIVIIFGLWLMSGGTSKKVVEELRKSDDIEADLIATEENIKKIEDQMSKSGKDNPIYLTAQQYYIKGFRDYKQGQYGRAILSFQAALTIYPQHELARKYAGLSRRRLDEAIQHEMLNGLKYKGQGNYRMCEGSYRKAIGQMLDEKDPAYQEAQRYLKECELLQKDKF